MKTTPQAFIKESIAPIVELSGLSADSNDTAQHDLLEQAKLKLERARSFSIPLLSGQVFDTGEPAVEHADGVSEILAHIGAGPSLRAASYLVYASEYLTKPEETISKVFGADEAQLAVYTRRLVQLQHSARDAIQEDAQGIIKAEQLERVRKMLLAFSRDLRVVLLRLASRLQTLRFFAKTKTICPRALAQETLQVFAPLANRLGIWQIKWELEDLSFRFLNPNEYQRIAKLLDEKRVERESSVEHSRERVTQLLHDQGIHAEVQGRPKHIYSIWKKMQGKGLSFDRLFDLRALRVIVGSVEDCYEALARIHNLMTPLSEEFDDYIARPKPNGYQSLHTVVLDEQQRPIEIQIRTQHMHEHAESGVAAHWAYKEAGVKGYAGVTAASDFERSVAEARKEVLRQLLAWERDLAQDIPTDGNEKKIFEDHIFVFTPQGAIIELSSGCTPIDFAYAVHTDLGHRCRGAKVDGVMVPLNTCLRSGQTVEISAVREGGPSLDWLNPELGFLKSSRSRAKVRAWFNAIAQQQTIARGREAVEKLLQREGKTSLKLEELASQLGFRGADALFEVVGKDEYSLRNIETVLRPAVQQQSEDELISLKINKAEGTSPMAPHGSVLVVGVDSLLTQLARCCKPAPPDAIAGYVTRGKGVAVHRTDCSNFKQLSVRANERVIPVTWGNQRHDAKFEVDLAVESDDRPGLLRDITEVLARDKINVTGVHSTTRQHSRGPIAHMMFSMQVKDSQTAQAAINLISQVPGVKTVRRR